MPQFGRNYLEVWMYTETRFPELGIRFIAVNDGVDSDDQMGSDFIPFPNIINKWYAKDTSKKIRAVFRNKGMSMSGQRLSTNAPYSYIRDEDGHLLVDEETAPTVELIFRLCVEGNGSGKIARMLKERGINELDAIIQRLYADRVAGTLSAERFAKLSESYEQEQAELRQSAEELRSVVTAAETQTVNIQEFFESRQEVHRTDGTDPSAPA